jgi:hypothetical protein
MHQLKTAAPDGEISTFNISVTNKNDPLILGPYEGSWINLVFSMPALQVSPEHPRLYIFLADL